MIEDVLYLSDETTYYVIKRKNKVKIWRTKDEQWNEGSCYW